MSEHVSGSKKKRTIASYALIFLALLVSYPLWNFLLPDFRFGPDIRFTSKIIDPNKSGFSPDAFMFEDYNSYSDMFYTLGKVFPKGTNKKDVLAKLKNSFGGFTPISVENVTQEIIKKEGLGNNLEHTRIRVRYEKIYPFSRCLLSSKPSDDVFGYLFDENDSLILIRYSGACLILGGYPNE